ncbi:hypothetical protein ACH4E8_28375 [Streptomyces sp. NPDC017979]|uniref:nSTAND1 domain-containing NTPase n=1 Tax=Streptomyces sp. NPDC017979 TaxID=3365024 RepID=UPI00379B40E4
MGRREKPLDPTAGPAQRLAHELRELRRAAGSPTYRMMARHSPYTAPTLSAAASGDRLPSLPVTLAYVGACGVDAEGAARWEERWHAAAADCEPVPAADEEPGGPYQGLARYGTEDGDRFFGRDDEVAELLDFTRRRPFAALVGASGSGKSSLLRAGLVPAVRKEGAARAPAVVRILTPGPTPARTHKDLFTPGALVVVDQFEEAFTLCRDPAERSAFVELLLGQDAARVVIAVRADFYGRCAEHPALVRALKDAVLLLGPMGPEQLRRAVVGPAGVRRLVVERALTARIVSDVADEPGGLPLMSHALLEVWRRRRGRTLTVAAYEAIGGVQGAIAHTAEQVFDGFTAEQAQAARALLLRLVSPGDGAQDTRRPADRTEVPLDQQGHVLERLVRARLLTVDDTTLELAHEALLTAWPRLRGWIEADRDALRLHRRLAAAARLWDDLGRDAGALYRGGQLDAAREAFCPPAAALGGAACRSVAKEPGGVRPRADAPRGRPGLRPPAVHPSGSVRLNARERDFLAASVAAHNREARAAARTARRLRAFTLTLSVLLCIAAVAGLVAWQQSRVSERRAVEAEARRIAAVSDAVRASDPRTAMRLALAAWQLAETHETREALFAAAAQPYADVFTPPVPRVDVDSAGTWRSLSDDGRTMTSVTAERTERWDVTTHRKLPDLPGLGRYAAKIRAVSPDGTAAAYRAADGVRVRDLASGRDRPVLARPLDRGNESDDHAWFGPGGRILGTHREGQPIRLFDASTGRHLLSTGREPGEIRRLLIAPDDRLLAFCPAEGPLRLWDVRTGLARPTPAGLGAMCDAGDDPQFHPDGRAIAVDAIDGLRTWDVSTGQERPRIPVAGLSSFDFSDDGSHVATIADREIRLWRLASDGPPVTVLRVPLGRTGAGAPRLDLAAGTLRYEEGSPPGATVWTVTFDRSAASDRNRQPATAARYGPDGGVLAVERADSRELHHVAGRRPATVLPRARTGARGGMAFSSDGRTFAHTNTAGGVTLLDLPSGTATHSAALPADLDGGLSVNDASGPDGIGSVAVSRSTLHPTERHSVDSLDARGRLRSTLVSAAGGILTTAPDGRILTGHRSLVDPRTRRAEPEHLAPGEKTAQTATFSSDGRYFAMSDLHGRTTLWSDTGRRLLAVLTPARSDSTPDEEWHEPAIAFSPDGGTLAYGDGSGRIRLWSTTSPRSPGAPLPTADGPVLALAFTSDGQELRITTPHTTSRTHPLSPAAAVRRVCARADGGLSRAQWRSHLPGVPYRSPGC